MEKNKDALRLELGKANESLQKNPSHSILQTNIGNFREKLVKSKYLWAQYGAHISI